MRRSLVLLAGLLTCTLSPAAAGAASVLATVPDPTPVASYGGMSAWSTPSPAGYRLTVSGGAAPRMLPVPPRAVPFDVDLGPGEQGQVVAVYSRCAREPLPGTQDASSQVAAPPAFASGGLPAYTSGRGCDIYRVDLDGGSEQKLAGASTEQASETLPTIWRNEVAFARVYEQRQGARNGFELNRLPYVYVRRLDGFAGSRRQPGDSRGSSGVPGPTSLDLYGRRLGFLWELDGRGETPRVRARVVTDGTSTDVVGSVGGGGLSRAWFVGTGFDAGRFLFGIECFGDPGGCQGAGLHRKVARYRLSTRTLEAAPLPGTGLLALGAGGGSVDLLDARPRVPEIRLRSDTDTCSPQDGDVATDCDIVRVPDGELSFGAPPEGVRR